MAKIAKHIPVNAGTAKAWSNLNGTGTIAERDSFNISGYVDNGTSDYTFTISSDMSSANYSFAASGCRSSGGIPHFAGPQNDDPPLASALPLKWLEHDGTAADPSYALCQIHGDLA